MRTATDTLFRHVATLTAIPVYPRMRSTSEIHAALLADSPDYAVTVRTVQRSLEVLSARFPIGSETHGRTNHWFWTDPNGFTQIPAMGESTAFVLRLAREHLQSLMPRAALRRLTPYFRHADEVLAGTALGRWVDRARVLARGPLLEPPDIRDEVQEAIYDAVLKDRQVEVDYRSRAGGRVLRIVLNPLGVVVRDGVVYLVATSWEYEDARHYVLHRMANPRLLETPAKAPKGFRLAAHIADEQQFSYPMQPDRLRLRALFERDAALHLMESRLSADQRTTERDDGYVLIEATVADTADLRWWLLGFGSGVEVLEPTSLREEFRQQARALHATYKGI